MVRKVRITKNPFSPFLFHICYICGKGSFNWWKSYQRNLFFKIKIEYEVLGETRSQKYTFWCFMHAINDHEVWLNKK